MFQYQQQFLQVANATYSFALSGISELWFNASNAGQTWSGSPIGSLTFTSAVPEPSTMFLIAMVGVLYLPMRSILRKRYPCGDTKEGK